jgi:hypothetical protein
MNDAKFDRLRKYSDDVNAILDLYNEQKRIPEKDIDEARGMYRHLKRKLEAEVNACRSNYDSWYAPTITEAFYRLASAGTKPETWFSGLYDAQADFKRTIASHLGQKEKR